MKRGRSLRACLGAWLIAALLLATGCVHVSSSHPKGFSETRSTAEQLESALKPRRWAVVIGIDRYDDPTFNSLQYAVADAKSVARVFRDVKTGGFDQVISLTARESTTRAAILGELRRLRNDLRRQDTLVVYFSGHGTFEYGADGGPVPYLVATDSLSTDLRGTAVDVEALRRFIQALKPQRKVMILDSCFSGEGKSRISSVTRTKLESDASVWPPLAQSFGQSEAMLMASTLGGIAQEDDGLRQGVYTYYLLHALTTERTLADTNHDGAVTVYEAHDYARSRAVERTHGTQIPEGYFRVLGQAEIYLAGTPDAKLAKNAALVYAYRSAEGMKLEVDGRARGAFPQTMVVEPGERQVVVRDDSGAVVAEGALRFVPGRDYRIDTLLDEVKGYRGFVSLETGGTLQLLGPAVNAWGRQAAWFGLGTGYRVRGGVFSGLTSSLTLGYAAIRQQASDGTRTFSSAYTVDARLMERRSFRWWQAGIGVHGSAILTPSLAGTSDSGDSATGTDSTRRQRLLHLPVGPLIWGAVVLNHRTLLTLEARSAWFHGSFIQTQKGSSNVQLYGTVGLELSF